MVEYEQVTRYRDLSWTRRLSAIDDPVQDRAEIRRVTRSPGRVAGLSQLGYQVPGPAQRTLVQARA